MLLPLLLLLPLPLPLLLLLQVLRRGFDPYIVESLMAELEAHGPAMHKLSTPTEIIKQADGSLSLVTADGQQHDGFDCILSAIGRKHVIPAMLHASLPAPPRTAPHRPASITTPTPTPTPTA